MLKERIYNNKAAREKKFIIVIDESRKRALAGGGGVGEGGCEEGHLCRRVNRPFAILHSPRCVSVSWHTHTHIHLENV